MNKEKCAKCGSRKTWILFDTKGKSRVCKCELNLDGGILLYRGMSSGLDKQMGWLTEVLSVNK